MNVLAVCNMPFEIRLPEFTKNNRPHARYSRILKNYSLGIFLKFFFSGSRYIFFTSYFVFQLWTRTSSCRVLQNKNSQSYLTDFFHRQYHSYRYFDVKNKYLTCWEYLTLGPVGLGKEDVPNSQKICWRDFVSPC